MNLKSKRVLLAVTLLSCLTALLSTSPGHAATVTSLGNFVPYGIDGNKVVGTLGLNATSAYEYDGTTYTPIAFPGSAFTFPQGVSGQSIVGYYDLTGSFVGRGFVFNGSAYSSFSVPGAKVTIPFGINANQIVGEYVDASGVEHGFLNDGASWTTLNAPLGTKGTFPHGVSGNNIIGYYTDSTGNNHPFLYNGSNWSVIPSPAITALGISGNRVVGDSYIYDISTGSFSYPLNISQFPGGATSFQFNGISGNTLVGTFNIPLSGTFGFTATIPEPSTSLLSFLGGVIIVFSVRRARARASPHRLKAQSRAEVALSFFTLFPRAHFQGEPFMSKGLGTNVTRTDRPHRSIRKSRATGGKPNVTQSVS